jgi:hypothetical protein
MHFPISHLHNDGKADVAAYKEASATSAEKSFDACCLLREGDVSIANVEIMFVARYSGHC